jgi:nitrile hydratase subunit alpha
MSTTRRDFLSAAVALAGATPAAGAIPGAGDLRLAGHDHSDVPPDIALRVKSLESLLVEKGIVDSAALDALVDTFENKVGPRNGAKVVARAWVDPPYKARLLANSKAAIAELGFTGWQDYDIVAVENTPQVHNLIVCTLCSCYPWPLLGMPPTWYKSTAYRSRAVIDPRGFLREIGTVIDDTVEVRVWDSTAEERYFVLPERPAGTESMSEEALAHLVTRDSMIGARKISRSPEETRA